MIYRVSNFLLLFLLIGRAGYAAVPTSFALLDNNPSIAWSVTPLNKGDVMEVHAFKAQPGTIVYLGICNDTCDSAHVVKSIAVYRPPANNASEKYTLEENGHLVFWTVQPPRLELHAGATSPVSPGHVAVVVHSSFSGLSNGAEIMQIRKSEIDPEHIKVRFDEGCYITLSRISAASP